MTALLQKSLIFLINIYRNCLSVNKLRTCRFHPTCSAYSIDSLKKYGPYKGLGKAVLRIVRCHPFNKGGYDPA